MAYSILYETQLAVDVDDDDKIIGYHFHNYGIVDVMAPDEEALHEGQHGWDITDTQIQSFNHTVDLLVDDLNPKLKEMIPKQEVLD